MPLDFSDVQLEALEGEERMLAEQAPESLGTKPAFLGVLRL